MTTSTKRRSGPVFDGYSDAPSGASPMRRTYSCFADQCPMPGTLFTGNTNAAGCCAWHYGAPAHAIPRITCVMRDWDCVSSEINAARVALNGTMATDPNALHDAFRAAWGRLKPLAGTWAAQLKPGPLRRSDGTDRGLGMETYAQWGNRLERFLMQRVREAVQLHHEPERADEFAELMETA